MYLFMYTKFQTFTYSTALYVQFEPIWAPSKKKPLLKDTFFFYLFTGTFLQIVSRPKRHTQDLCKDAL